MTENMEVLEHTDAAMPQDQPLADTQKVLTQEEVNRIVKREKLQAADRARRETEAKYQQELDQLRAQPQATQPMDVAQAQAPGSLNHDDVYKHVYDRLLQDHQKAQEDQARAEQEKSMQDIASKYFLKMGKGSEMFDDFEEVTKDFQPAAFPQVVYLAAEFENTPELMYELSKSPQKLAAVDQMAQKSPGMAKKMLQQISDSIVQNKQAKDQYVSGAQPLSRLKSSTAGSDTGQMTIQDFKKMPWLRG